MSVTYSPKKFLQGCEKDFLAEYFNKHSLLADIDIASLKPKNCEPILDAIKALPKEAKNRIDDDFIKIYEIANNKVGIQELKQTLSYKYNIDFPKFNKHTCKYNQAMWAFLNYSDAFDDVYSILKFKSKKSFLHKFKLDNIELYNPSQENIKLLTDAISSHLQQEQGRGELCKFEKEGYNDCEYIHIYPSDYVQQQQYYKDEELEIRTEQPAFEIVFFFHAKEQMLEVYYNYGRSQTIILRNLFLKHILGINDISKVDKASINIKILADKNMLKQLNFPADSKVEKLAIHMIKFSPLRTYNKTHGID
jgi:hypothetical protein